jgi:hypothetical protein
MKQWIAGSNGTRHIINLDKVVHVEISAGGAISEKHLIFITITYAQCKPIYITVFNSEEEIKGSKDTVAYTINELLINFE